MASKNESGHAKNVANLEELISIVTGFGEKYKPVNETAKITFLQTLLSEARTTMDVLSMEKVKLDAATNKRVRTFVPLRKLSTRLLAAYTQVAEDEELDDLRAHHRKIQGTRAIKKPKPKPEDEQQPEGEKGEQTDRSISVSQQSFDNLVEHFSKIIERLKGTAEYKPNEMDLRTESLATMLGEMKDANSAVKVAATPYKNSMTTRNDVLYKPKMGLKATVGSVKRYVLSVYGHGTPEHRLVSGLKFTAPRRRR